MRTIPIHQSLHRQAHVMGAERELVLSCGLIAILVGIGGLTVLSFAAAGCFWILSVFILRQMAKADPIMSKIWLRHIKQQEYYGAKSHRWRTVGGYTCSN